MSDDVAVGGFSYQMVTLQFRDTGPAYRTRTVYARLNDADQTDPRFLAFKEWFDEVCDRNLAEARKSAPTFGVLGGFDP